MEEKIIIKGARENNLKNVNLEIPRNKLVVFTGVSGSGKSTMAFDTIFAEGQRRYVESLSSYARMFLGQTQKPDIDSIDGLSPSISIDQKTTNNNPRSTVGTVTEIYDYFRLLFARVGTPYCPHCNKPIEKQSIDQIVDKVLSYEEGSKILILAPVVRGQKGAFEKLFASLKKSGYVRVNIDGNQYTFDEEINLDKNIKHNISVVVDRLIVKKDIKSRLTESLEVALKLAEGLVYVEKLPSDSEKESLVEVFNINFSCSECGYSIEEISPRLFSFNAPYGACEACTGLGYTLDIDESLVLKNSHLSINQGALNITGWNIETGSIASMYLKKLAVLYDIDMNTPLKDLPKNQLDILLYGSKEKIEFDLKNEQFEGHVSRTFEGLINNLKRRYKETTSEFIKFEIGKLMRQQKCKKCGGKRLNEKALSVKIDGKDIIDFCSISCKNLLTICENLKFCNKEAIEIAEPILKEIKARLKFLFDVGLGYLSLSRSADSLSGGESQRIRLATQIGSGLIGVLYILDEPSIGLHQRDNEMLLQTMEHLRDLGNTLIVVEHDEDTIRRADHIVDFGPYAGVHGGEIVAQGKLEDIEKCEKSITGKYLSGKVKIEVPKERRTTKKGFLKISGAKLHNLKNISVDIPLGVLNCVTGVSGSGKSSLINGVLYPYLANKLNRANLETSDVDIENVNLLDKVIMIDQAPIGRTPRSNPATYTGVFTAIRDLFAMTKDAKERGYKSGRFSFNVRGGRCEACEGAGYKEIEMYFLPDITVPCEVCHGKRFNRETLEVKYKGKSIADVLDMTVEEALNFFENIPAIKNKMQALFDVGLGYIKLGQSATTLSGGEAQRVKLATELAKRSTGKTIYVLDEPTTGLHMFDVHKLIDILNRLVDAGNTVVCIEHNLDVIKSADYIIDLGPEGGDEGGNIVSTGTPEEICKNKKSYTGMFLKKILN